MGLTVAATFVGASCTRKSLSYIRNSLLAFGNDDHLCLTDPEAGLGKVARTRVGRCDF
jgi:hypothetical protein